MSSRINKASFPMPLSCFVKFQCIIRCTPNRRFCYGGNFTFSLFLTFPTPKLSWIDSLVSNTRWLHATSFVYLFIFFYGSHRNFISSTDHFTIGLQMTKREKNQRKGQELASWPNAVFCSENIKKYFFSFPIAICVFLIIFAFLKALCYRTSYGMRMLSIIQFFTFAIHS